MKETKRNETKRNETKRNETKRKEKKNIVKNWLGIIGAMKIVNHPNFPERNYRGLENTR
jgi:hypothetical protein